MIQVALFRGINVGGHSKLPMKQLVADLEAIGCTSVRTYIQSGNAVFESKLKNPQLKLQIADRVRAEHGFDPAVHLLGLRELRSALAANPFPEAEADPKTLHLFFLAETPTSNRLSALHELKADSERLALLGKVLYLHAPEGIGRSKLATRAEAKLGVSATARNWRTVSRLLELAEGME